MLGHCRGANSIIECAKAGMDLILHATLMDEAALETIVELKTPIMPVFTFQANLIDYGAKIGADSTVREMFRREIADSATMLKRAYDAGVPLLCGSESGFSITPYGDWHYRELEVFVRDLGLTPLQAIQCATQANALSSAASGAHRRTQPWNVCRRVGHRRRSAARHHGSWRQNTPEARVRGRPRRRSHAPAAAYRPVRLARERLRRATHFRSCTRGHSTGIPTHADRRALTTRRDLLSTVTLTRIPDALAALRNEHLAQSLYDEGKVIMDGTLLTLHGAAHRNRRLLEFRVFRRSFFRYYETHVFPSALQELIGGVIGSGRCDLVDFGTRITMNLTADFAGIDRPLKSAQETADLLGLVRLFSEGATMVHTTRDKAELRDEVRDALHRFDAQFLRPSIARRAALLVQLARGEIEETALPPRRSHGVAAKRGPARAALPIWFVAKLRFICRRARTAPPIRWVHAMHDMFTWFAAHPEDRARINDDPIFLQRCVHESLRLHPASPVAWRKPVCPVHVSGAGDVDVEDRVEIDLWTANRSTDVYGADAADFNPHRTVAQGNEPFGLTFGTGVHTCLGRDLDGGIVPKGRGRSGAAISTASLRCW